MHVAQGIAMLMPQRLEMLPQFLKVVDPTVAIDPAPLSFVLPKPKSKPQWQSLYHPFQPMMWVLVISLNLIIPTAFILIAYAGGHLESGTGVRTVRVLLWQDQGRLPTLAPARLLLLGWMIFALLIGVSYRCKLTAFLTIHKFPERPETVQELAKTGIP
ncbi:hypothetical protein Pmani_000449 [Petrolisthes manimaculis]|uniref:Uncharacterized protein n=1 Tax=Petrolisthes manimaculis TaxID=1843537 RepID=A0AAE1U9Q3_9EUCA|nr:hypothetical protein Pmani_013044 [Petrolisthes manimaculis]KAK4329222.1 hypothetical protein Pmani_000449 [Petrolisthes manimaculis]